MGWARHQRHRVHYAGVMAMAILEDSVMVAFLFFQRQIVQGIAGSGMKG